MTQQNSPTDREQDRALSVEPGQTDLGDDVYRGPSNRGSTMGNSAATSDQDPGSGLPVDIDPGTTDLGDDARRPATEG